VDERTDAEQWWRHAVIYQVYPRSFADGDGDGIGDLVGVEARLNYLVGLGVDAIWFTPWYASPWADGGYDVADYRRIDPRIGTLAQAEHLIAAAARRGVRVIVDIVPNHVSSQHPWFQAALAAAPGSPERGRFWFRDGAGPAGDGLPTLWQSSFHGQTWTRTTDPDGRPGQWYLHLFTPEQPDLNWDNPQVRAEHEDVLRFWFDRGVAGVRVDSATLCVKDPALPEEPGPGDPVAPGEHPFIDRDGVHDIYRAWRAIADAYDPPRLMVGEVWLPDVDRFAAYLRPDEMHTAFNFDFMAQPWEADALRRSIDVTLGAHRQIGAPPTWVLSNHDVTRPVTRYGRAQTGFAFADKRFGVPTDLELGTRRARAAALITAALPGCLYIYQGDELGLPEDEQIPLECIEDPMYARSGGVDPGRDGCRVPLPWEGDPRNNFGFSTPAADAIARPSWLPQPAWWGRYAVQGQAGDPGSMLAFYRQILALRRDIADLAGTGFAWLDGLPATCLAFRRGRLACIVNFADAPVRLPSGRILAASGPLEAGRLGADTGAWIELADAATREAPARDAAAREAPGQDAPTREAPARDAPARGEAA